MKAASTLERQDLALLLRDHAREVLGILPERGRDLAQVPGSLDGCQLLPVALRLLGGADRLPSVLERRVGTSETICPVDGFSTWIVLPPSASTKRPSM